MLARRLLAPLGGVAVAIALYPVTWGLDDFPPFEFILGSNTGLVHSFVDTTVKNGFTYYYAVTAYDHGDVGRGIP